MLGIGCPDRHALPRITSPKTRRPQPVVPPARAGSFFAYKQSLDGATKFIPIWVKVSVAIALGLGTMVGWKRIVITVGEKIGKSHLTYGQGAAAELVRGGHHRGSRRLRSPGVDHPCPVIGGRRDHGGKRVGTSAIDAPQHRDGVDIDLAGGNDAVGVPLHPVPASVLTTGRGGERVRLRGQ
jgi:hypothetical protein